MQRKESYQHISFLAFYSISVILSRILFGGVLSSKNPVKYLPLMLVLMSTGLVIIIFNHHNDYIYMLSSSLIGVSYGLAYPLIKTYAVKTSESNDRHQAIAFFTLSYFFGVYFFPLVASFLFIYYSTNGYLLLLLTISILYLIIAQNIQTKSLKYFEQ